MSPTEQEHATLSERLVAIATRAATEAGALVVDRAGQVAIAAEKRGFYDPVTACDVQSEELIVEQIFRGYPDSTLVGEEGGSRGSGSVRWYVDPIDGTNNFVSGIPFFCVSIGAALGDRMLAGVIYDPVRQELFAASLRGAFLNGAPIRCVGRALDSEATVLTSFPLSGGRAAERDLLRYGQLVAAFRSVRRLGSTALNLAYVACGRADAAFEESSSPWDIAAGLFIVQQAGGRCFVPERPGGGATRPWLSPIYLACCPELDLARSSLGGLLWPGLRDQYASAVGR